VYDRLAEERGPAIAAAVLRETPNQFGVLHAVEEKRAFGLYTIADTTAARDHARSAAFLAEGVHQARVQAATPIDLREARAARDRLVQQQATLRETGRSLPSLHGREGQVFTHGMATQWERLGDLGRDKLRHVLSEAQWALGQKLVVAAKDLVLDRDQGRER
jgi:hypothetical protein